MSGRLFWPLLSLLLLLAVWEVAALLAPAASLPSPAQVARVMAEA